MRTQERANDRTSFRALIDLYSRVQTYDQGFVLFSVDLRPVTNVARFSIT